MTCRRAAELISLQLDIDLPAHRLAGLAIHTLLCGACRRFRRQLVVVDEAAGGLLGGSASGAAGASLPAATREHLEVLIRQELDS
jgi:hypothetical protein